MIKLIEKALSHDSVAAEPPVFVDIGASGSLPDAWTAFAPYSICLAFDADDRDFEVAAVEGGDWKRLYTLNRLVSDRATNAASFYLTRSPHCSSSLSPDNDALRPWAFASYFDLERTINLPAVDLASVLKDLKITGIDWYKSDSQGTDLRIFRALSEEVQRSTLVAQFEPGIIDAYRGEDKLHALMAYMDSRPFWVTEMIVKGSQRIDAGLLKSMSNTKRRHLRYFHKTAPGWAEISYMNTLDNANHSIRSHLLTWAFATTLGENGFAHHVAETGLLRFSDPLFDEMRGHSKAALMRPNSYRKMATAAVRRGVRAIGFG